MRLVALVSGGKDSCYNMMLATAAGHEIVALANLRPSISEETDSYMYQTVGTDGVDLYGQCMELPLFRKVIMGRPVVQDKQYAPREGDEVEDLFSLLSDVRKEVPFDGVAVGAILSDYQRIRVENVCQRLGAICVSYLWRRDQEELLQEMIDSGVEAIIIKTAALGLNPHEHLGQSISAMQSYLIQSSKKYGLNVCGEGGEYETFTLDCPLFKHKIVLDKVETVIHSDDAFAPVGYLKLEKAHLEDKLINPEDSVKQLKTPLDFIQTILKNPNTEISSADGEEEETEIVPSESSSSSTQQHPDDVPTHSQPEVNHVAQCQEEDIEIEYPAPSDTLSVVDGNNGWMWVMGVQGRTDSTVSPIKDALMTIEAQLNVHGKALSDLVCVCIYVSSMQDYAQLNQEYIKHFGLQPPVRVCVETHLPRPTTVMLDAIAYSSQSPNNQGDSIAVRQCMHVQSISNWAPANIGPYSQAIWVEDIIYLAGQIGLVPGSMELISGDAQTECRLCLRSLRRIISAADPGSELSNVVQAVCFVTEQSYVDNCKKEWEKQTENSIVEYVVVPHLPRNAKVEWQVWVHKYNSLFAYEETGFMRDNIQVDSFRRWDRETTKVASIVCRTILKEMDYRLERSDIKEVVDYTLKSLFCGEMPSHCSLRIFYKIGALNASLLFTWLKEELSKHSVAYSVVPVCSLRKPSVVLSFCGVRH